MDVVLLLVILGCALAGAWWGALRIATALVALAASILAGRFAGPVLADLLAGGRTPDASVRVGIIVGVGIVVALLVLLAGRGLRKGVVALHLSWLDRLGGMVLAGAGALALVAVLLVLAAVGGHRVTSPLASRVTAFAQGFLAVQSLSYSNSSPSKTPTPPTSKGQQPS
jgi:uncharacterized membrane protein required for colicin V production